MPNNIVFSNPGAALVQWGNGAATPYLTLSGLPSTGTVGVAVSGLVTNPSAATATWTVSSSPADAIITPSSGTLAPGVAVAFTLTALASGLKNVQLTSTTPNTIISGSPHSFTAASVAPPPPPPAPAASDLTLSMASTGTTGSATLVTVTPNAAIGATGTATLSVSGGGTLGTSTLNFTAGSSAAQSTTLTRTTDGTTTLTMTNNMGLSNIGSPASYGSTSAASTGTPQPFTLDSASSGVLPFAIGYAMSQGHVPAGQGLSFAGATAKLTVLSSWPDGSARHGIIAGTYTSAGAAVTVTPTVATVTAGTALTGAAVQTAMGANTAVFDAGAFGSATFSGADFATPFVTHAATDTFIEAIYRKQIGSDAHLVAWLSLRVWSSGQVEALPWVENGFIRVVGQTSKSATYSFTLGGASRFSAAIDLPARTRTPLVSGALLSHWLVTDPAVVVKHDAAYMMATRLVPTYGATVSPSAVAVTGLSSTFTPLQLGNFTTPMGNAGYQPAIGLLPEWDALYLTCTSSSVWSALQRNAYSAGRWGIYYRDENTNRPLRFSQFPNLSSNNSTTSDFPASSTGTAAPSWDIPHHPSVGYMAYLITGRWFHMETVQFAAAFNYLANVDGGPYANRNGSQGLFKTQAGANTTRGAAWALRTLAQAATVTPDSDTALRAEFVASLEANINYYHGRFVTTTNNPYGIVDPYGDAYGSPSDGKVTEAPWQQNFFTAATGYALALNPPISSTAKTKLQAFFAWKAKSIVGMLGTTSATDWLYRDAAAYTYVVALVDTPDFDTGAGPWPSSWGAMYDATFTTSPGSRVDGNLRNDSYPDPTNRWGNLQPAIAYAVEHGAAGASDAFLRMAVTSGNFASLETSFNDNCVWSVTPPNDPRRLPSWVPAPGATANINLNTLTSVDDCPSGTCWWSGASRQRAPWRNWTGATYASGFSQYGAMQFWGGGHGGGDNHALWNFDLTTRMWSRIGPSNPPTAYTQEAGALGWYDYLWEGSYIVPSLHTYNYPVYVPPTYAGAGTKGQWLLPHLVGGADSGSKPHAVDLATGVWTRATSNFGVTDNGETYSGSIMDTTRGRVYWAAIGASRFNKIDLADSVPRAVSQVNITGGGGNFAFGGYYAQHRYVPEADRALGMYCYYAQTSLRGEVFNFATGNPVSQGVITSNLPALTLVHGAGFGFDWCPITQAFYLYEGRGTTTVYKLKPSTLDFGTCTWTLTTETFSNPAWDAATGASAQGPQPFTRWSYIPALRCFAWSDGPDASGVCVDGVTRTGIFQLWRPAGT